MISSLLAFALLAAAQVGPGPTLQPRTEASPSGLWTLFVDPTRSSGAGPAHVVVQRDGKTAWETDLPFTFWEARITDAGFVAGYAFTAGWRDMRGEGDFVVAILGPDGRGLREEHVARTWSRFLHFPPNPDPLGVFVQPELDRLVVRIADEDVNRQDEEWWSYVLSTGEALDRVRPKAGLGVEASRFSLDAQPVAGMPLTLSVWHEYDVRWDEGTATRFVLLDEEWRPVWSLGVPKPSRRVEQADQPVILAADGTRHFAIWDLHERVLHEVVPDAQVTGGWAVREVSREPWPVAKPAPAPLKALALPALPTVPLEAVVPPAEPVHDVLAFDFDAEGRVLLVRGRRDESTASLLRLELDGAVLGEASFRDPTAGTPGRRTWHALAHGRWLFSFSPFGEDARSRAWLVEAKSGTAQEVPGFDGPSLEAGCATPDGGVVLLGSYHRAHTINESLLSLGPEGQRRWEIVQKGYTGAPSELMACEDVAVGAGGEVLVLDSTRDAVLAFDAAGAYQRTVTLPESWGDDVYPVALRVLPGGDWLVFNFTAHAWHRMSPQGDDRGRFVARREDGGAEIGHDVRIDPSGTLWGTDGASLFAFDEAGIARTRLGSAPRADVLTEPYWVQVDALGRIAVSDRRTHAVHVFDGSGRRTLVLRPDPEDFDGSHSTPTISTDSRGRAAIRLDSFEGRYLDFEPDGRRSGIVRLGGELVAFVPGSGDRWVASNRPAPNVQIRRLTSDGRELVKLDRRPNNEFFTHVRALACEADGSVWVLSGAISPRSTADLVVDRFSPTGEPQRSISLASAPPGGWHRLAATGHWLLVSTLQDTALLVAVAEGTVASVRCDGVTRDGCGFGFSPDGAELWCVLPQPLELRRFELPDRNR